MASINFIRGFAPGLCAALLLSPVNTFAKGGALCGAGKATSTVYNLPLEDKKDTWPDFKTFQSAVKMQGSGKRKNGNIARYKGGDVSPPKNCNTTTTSSSGQCLLPYFSIAADPKSGFRMGDIIYMRSLADQEITLPTGRKVRHPGFLIVHDVGGAIKGAGRFDFFVGTTNPRKNGFDKFKLADKKSCANKEFQKLQRGSPQYHTAFSEIYKNQDADSSTKYKDNNSGAGSKSLAWLTLGIGEFYL